MKRYWSAIAQKLIITELEKNTESVPFNGLHFTLYYNLIILGINHALKLLKYIYKTKFRTFSRTFLKIINVDIKFKLNQLQSVINSQNNTI